MVECNLTVDQHCPLVAARAQDVYIIRENNSPFVTQDVWGTGRKMLKGNSFKLWGRRGHAFTHSLTPKWTVIAESECECIFFLCSFCCCYISHSFSQHFLGGFHFFIAFLETVISRKTMKHQGENINKKGRKKAAVSLCYLSMWTFLFVFLFFVSIKFKSNLSTCSTEAEVPPGVYVPLRLRNFSIHILFIIECLCLVSFCKNRLKPKPL